MDIKPICFNCKLFIGDKCYKYNAETHLALKCKQYEPVFKIYEQLYSFREELVNETMNAMYQRTKYLTPPKPYKEIKNDNNE